MKTPKEKAIRLFTIMYGEFENGISYKEAKRCALIAVDEILKTNTLQDRNCGFVTLCEKHKEYCLEVKQELEKLCAN
jgi:hypothetical protein